MNDTQVQIIGALLFVILAVQIVQARYLYRIHRRLRRLVP